MKWIAGLLAVMAIILSGISSGGAETKNGNPLKGHLYELKSIGFEGKACDKYIDILINPDQKELVLKKFKFKVGSDWGVVSNDSTDTVHLDSIKKVGDSKVLVIGSEAQDTDDIKVTIELSDYDQDKERFTKSLVSIVGDSTGGCEGELILTLKNLHMHVFKIR